MRMNDRRQALAGELDQHDAHIFLSSAMPDIRYYTGCLDVGGYLIVTRTGDAILITNAHDAPQASAETIATEVRVWRPGEDSGALLISALRAMDGDVLSPGSSFVDACSTVGKRLVVAPAVTTHLRRVKEDTELALIHDAVRIVEAGMAVVRDGLRPGIRETEVAAQAELVMRRMGSDGRVFETKIESGPRSAMPSTYAGERRIEAGDLVLVDIGPTYRGYFGDLSRTFAIGDPTPAQRQLLEVVLAAEEAGIAAVREGVAGQDIDAAAREPMRVASLENRFLHHTGHTLGLAGDSLSLLQPGESATLRAGECVTVEPGLYVPGVGGVRIEDEVLVTSDGCEVLTSFDKRLESLILNA